MHPDIILIGGDILGGIGDPDLNKLKMQFRRLRAKYGTYAVLGNHEFRQIGRRFVPWIGREFYSDSGVKLLEDEVEKVDGAFYLAGRSCVRTPRKPVEELLKDAPEHLPVLLLDHYPPDSRSARQKGVDLQLSGHTHNGELFPINLFSALEYELAYGTKTIGTTQYVVSSGLHYAEPPVNTQGYSEMLFIKAVFRPDIGCPVME
jgi:predicted MPP superfamily phosphohydrolase